MDPSFLTFATTDLAVVAQRGRWDLKPSTKAWAVCAVDSLSWSASDMASKYRRKKSRQPSVLGERDP